MKKSDKTKELMLEQLRKTPIVQVACEKVGVSRMTFYRWRKEDAEFSALADQAMSDGRMLVSDLAESQLVGAIKDKNFPAIAYWLRHHHPAYANKLEIKHEIHDDALTPEQESMVRDALRFASLAAPNINNNEQNQRGHEQQQQLHPEGSRGSDDQG